MGGGGEIKQDQNTSQWRNQVWIFGGGAVSRYEQAASRRENEWFLPGSTEDQHLAVQGGYLERTQQWINRCQGNHDSSPAPLGPFERSPGCAIFRGLRACARVCVGRDTLLPPSSGSQWD